MSSLAWSVLLSLVSAVAYAAGAVVQERVAAAGAPSVRALLRDGAWWVAVTLNGAGAVLHVAALAYGPLSLVQPLGALTIVFALPMAALFAGRGTGRAAWRGALMATAGLAGLLALTGRAGSHSLSGPDRSVLAAGSAVAVAALFLLAKGLRPGVPRGVVLAAGAGVAFGMASVFTKTVAADWTSGTVGSGLPTLAVIGVLASAGLLLSQAAYRGAGLTAPLAIVTVVNPVVAAAVGISFFGEQFRHGTAGAVLAPVCGALAATGLVLLTAQRPKGPEDGRGGAGGEGAAVPGPVVPGARTPAGPGLPEPVPPLAPGTVHASGGGPAASRPAGTAGQALERTEAGVHRPAGPGPCGVQTLAPPALR
ncbi:DMT family transporter [Streptomyces nitrosporeus]|uniref:DMT family transporter n=1 Tax=Streptomyces nitrosporeus TaxID=28894 RepID=UPI0039A05559